MQQLDSSKFNEKSKIYWSGKTELNNQKSPVINYYNGEIPKVQ